MLICIDAGHGLLTAGKRCLKSIDPNETREWMLNRRIADKLQNLLEDYECQTMRVDDTTGEKDVPLAERVSLANEAGADVYLSIHHNAGMNGGAGGGIVIFAATMAGKMALKLQKAVYDAAVERTGLRGNRANSTPQKDLYVLRKTGMPAILGEFGFMDSTADTPVILTETFADQAAAGIAEGVVQSLELKRKDGNTVDYEEWKRYMERYRQEMATLAPSPGLEGHVIQAVELGITTGERPQDFALREEVMAMVKNMSQNRT